MDDMKIEKYPSYKDSGTNWLGEVPSHWELTRLATRFAERRTKVSDKDFEPLSVTKNGILPQLEDAAKTNDGDNRKLVRKGDFVINSRSDRKGSSGISPLDGSVSLINIVLEPKEIDSKFCNYLLKGNNFIEEFYRNGHGIVADLWTTRYDEMKLIKIAIPPKEEQTAIAQFLDRKTAQINKAIAQKEKLIQLLKERRQILIHKGVTRGLSPNVKMKDSGVEWIGEIPEHWEVRRLRTLIDRLDSGVSVNASESESAMPNEIGVLKTSCVYNYSFDPLENKRVFDSDLRRVSCPVRQGTIIISRMNAPELVGASGYVGNDYPNLFLPDRLWQASLKPGQEVDGRWLSIVLKTESFKVVLTTICTGSSPSMKNISKGDFLNLRVPFPSIYEQMDILRKIHELESRTKDILGYQQDEIEKLKEYKATLINSAVTGKIKVC